MAVIGAADTSGNIIGVGFERFTVMHDLTNIEPPVNFSAGVCGGLRGYGQDIGARRFQWRSHWNPDEYYQTMYQIGMRTQRANVMSLQGTIPQRRNHRLWFIQQDVDAAYRNGCKLYLTINTAIALYNGNTPPTTGDGSWCFREGVRASDADSGGAATRRLFFPTRPDIQLFARDIATQFGSKIAGFELFNEVNLFNTADSIVDLLFEPFYATFKNIAPDVPVLMDATMDFGANGTGYINDFFAAGGAKYSDGFSYHPYGRSSISMNDRGINFIQENHEKSITWAKNGQPLIMAQSEEQLLGGGAFDGWEIMQRILLDWAAGARWSIGQDCDKLYFLEANKLQSWEQLHRGPRAPGRAAVAINALYYLLAGYQRTGMADYGGDNSDGTLALFLKKPDNSHYAVAIACGSVQDKCVDLSIDLSGIQFDLYDQWGASITNHSTPLHITREPKYLITTSADITNRFNNATVTWVNDPEWYETDLPYNGGSNPPNNWYEEYLRTAILPGTPTP
jgi:hypothetical protein